MPAEGTAVESCTIITMPPNKLMAEIHNAKQRMPAMLAAEDIEARLAGSSDDAKSALKPYPDEMMAAHPVSARVKSPKNSDPALVAAA